MPHLDALYGAAIRLSRSARDAEDLVQDAMVRAFRFWDSFDQATNCKAWLLRILTNVYLTDYQRRKRSKQILDAAAHEQAAADGVIVHEAAARFARPDDRLMNEVSDDVQRALEQLPDDFRIAVVMCDMEGLSYREIAEMLGCPVGTVMSRLFRGRKLLAMTLRGYAAAQGFAKPTDNTIDLAAYRKQRTKGGAP